MRLVPLNRELAGAIGHWFDDPATRRYLGGRDWLDRALDLAGRTAPGTRFRGRTIAARHLWLACDAHGAPCALVDVEPYSDATAGFALVVDPARRGRGIAREALARVADAPELAAAGTRSLIGAFEPENAAARACFSKAGFRIAAEPDAEDMLRIDRPLPVPTR